jgi:hypothetical protein
MSFSAVAHLDQGLSLEMLPTLKTEKFLICLVGTQTNSICNRIKFDFVLENINKK